MKQKIKILMITGIVIAGLLLSNGTGMLRINLGAQTIEENQANDITFPENEIISVLINLEDRIDVVELVKCVDKPYY